MNTTISYLVLIVRWNKEEHMFRNFVYITMTIMLAGLCLYAIYDFIILEHETWRNVITCGISFVGMLVTTLEIDLSDRE